jgi:hypothetical protein
MAIKRLTGVVDDASLMAPSSSSFLDSFWYVGTSCIIDRRLSHCPRNASHRKALPALGLLLVACVPLLADGYIAIHKRICSGKASHIDCHGPTVIV